MDISDRYLIYRAYYYHLLGEPIPVGLFLDLVEAGINPEDISASFAAGYEPPFLDEDEEDEYDEDDYKEVVVNGHSFRILGIDAGELKDLLDNEDVNACD